MAAMKKSEQMLLGVFAGLLFLAVTFFVLDVVADKKNLAELRQRAARDQIIEYQTLIRQKQRWEVRRAFVKQYQPLFRSEEDEMPDFEGYFRRQAAASVADDGTPIEIIELTIQPPEERGPGVTSIDIKARLKGPASSVLRFLVRLQAPDQFYTLEGFNFSADPKNPGTTKIDHLIFRRWYSTDGSTSIEGTTPAGAGTVANKSRESDTKAN